MRNRFLTMERTTQRASCSERCASSSTSLLEPRTSMEMVRPGLGTPVILTTLLLGPTVTSCTSSAEPSLSAVKESTCATGEQPSVCVMNSMSSRSMSLTTRIFILARKCRLRSLTASRRMDFWMSSTLQPAFWIFLHILRMYLRSSRRMRSMAAYSETTTLFSMSVLGAERQNWMRPTLAFSTRVMAPATWEAFLLKTRPFTSSVSSVVPPRALTTLILLRSTL
mmetsp:Transcript_50773/g.140652  ORF Transcript_50773/g.140652 Transcript_50773/m.140652 type:complete len:224 (-) Transcript_50773:635-1306(-)